MDATQIGEYIKLRRIELKINQQTLSDLSGVGINTILAIERGKGNPSLQTLLRITTTLGLDILIR